MADCFRRPFAQFKGLGHKTYEKKPSGLQKLNGATARYSTLRLRVLRLMGSNNLLVGFYIAWVLTALQHPLPASRLVELKVETSYQLLCKQLALEGKTFTPELFILQRVPYDSC